MKHVRTKIGRKLIGSLVSCSLLFSMLPGVMTSAADSLTAVNATPSTTVRGGGDAATYNGIILQGLTTDQDIKVDNSGKRFQADRGVTAEYTFSVDNIVGAPYARFEIAKIEIALTGTLSCTVSGTGWGTATANQTLVWQPSGGQTGQSSVSMTLNSTSAQNNGRMYFSTITVYVRPVMVTSVEISESRRLIGIGAEDDVFASYEPSNATYREVEWESDDPTIVTVDSEGHIVATGYGTATISAVAKNNSTDQSDWVESTNTCTVTVVQPATEISISESLVVYVGETGTISCQINPEGSYYEGVLWTSLDPTTIEVNDSGVVTGLSEGTGTVRAQLIIDGSAVASDTCTITVKTHATGIAIDETLTLYAGGSGTINYTIDPPRADYDSITWSVTSGSGVTVSNTGVVTATTAGTATIRADLIVGGSSVASDTCAITVNTPATGITIAEELELYAGSSKPIAYQVTPAGTSYDSITWSVTSGSGVTVSETGVVSASATATGTATIRADLIVDGSSVAYDTCEVTINTPATGIAIDETLTLYAGGLGIINYTIDPTGADYDSITWSVISGSGVTVSDTGVVTATAAGTATVQADLIVGGSSVASDTCTVTVVEPANGIDLPASASVFVGSSTTLSYTLSPEGATFDSITWSVIEPLGAPISINSTTGLITAGSSTGTATVRAIIRVGDSIYFDECTVTVCEIPVSAVTIDPSSATVAVGGSAALTAVVDPTTATASDWVWKVDDDTIAEISWDAGTCTVTGLAEGTAEVTVTIGGKSDTCTITVVSGEEPSITVSPSSLTLTVDGESGELSYTIVDCGHDITFLGFASSDTAVATVSEDGIVTPVGEGTATITATMMDNTLEQTYSAICDVTVSSEPGPGPEPGPEPGPDPEPEEPVLTYEEIVRIVVSNFVDRLYLVALNRPYDSAGREDWINQLMNGGSASGVARGFLTSAEFIGRGLSNEQFVTVLYKVYFDREPDATGFTNWVNALNNGTSRVQVMAEFAKSEEWAAFCARYYVVV